MSYRRVAAALRICGLKPTERLVLVYLADCENEKSGLCCPSYETIGRNVGLERRQVGRIIGDLVDRHGVLKASKTRTTYTYEFCFDKRGVVRTVSSGKTTKSEHCGLPDSSAHPKSSMSPHAVTSMSRHETDDTNILNNNREKESIKTCSCSIRMTCSTGQGQEHVGSDHVDCQDGCRNERQPVSSGRWKQTKRWCVDISEEERNEMNSWDVYHGLRERYNIVRLNHRVVNDRIGQLKRNGWRDTKGDPIVYVWPYLRAFAERIRDDRRDVEAYERNERIALEIAEMEERMDREIAERERGKSSMGGFPGRT